MEGNLVSFIMTLWGGKKYWRVSHPAIHQSLESKQIAPSSLTFCCLYFHLN